MVCDGRLATTLNTNTCKTMKTPAMLRYDRWRSQKRKFEKETDENAGMDNGLTSVVQSTPTKEESGGGMYHGHDNKSKDETVWAPHQRRTGINRKKEPGKWRFREKERERVEN